MIDIGLVWMNVQGARGTVVEMDETEVVILIWYETVNPIVLVGVVRMVETGTVILIVHVTLNVLEIVILIVTVTLTDVTVIGTRTGRIVDLCKGMKSQGRVGRRVERIRRLSKYRCVVLLLLIGTMRAVMGMVVKKVVGRLLARNQLILWMYGPAFSGALHFYSYFLLLLFILMNDT
jgi:hypothetical protein